MSEPFIDSLSDVRATPANGHTNGRARALPEFVGESDGTIAEAVRQALARASRSLSTLDGVDVVVIPQILRDGTRPRFRVTLQITDEPADHQGRALNVATG